MLDISSQVISSHFLDRLFPFVATTFGTGAQVNVLTGSGLYKGQAEVSSGTDADGKANIGLALDAITFSGGRWTLEALVQIPVLSDATNSFKMHVGFFDGLNGGQYAAFIKYIHSYESGQFTCQTVNGEEPANTSASGITVVAGQWYLLKIVADLSIPSIKYYINNSFITEYTTNLPIGATLGAGVLITKTGGTTARKLLCDALKITCPRATISTLKSGYWDDSDVWEGGAVPGNLDSPRILKNHTIKIRTPVIINQPNSNNAPFQIDNGGRLIIESGSLTITDDTQVVINGNIDVYTQLQFPAIAVFISNSGCIRRMVSSSRVIFGTDGFCYRN